MMLNDRLLANAVPLKVVSTGTMFMPLDDKPSSIITHSKLASAALTLSPNDFVASDYFEEYALHFS